MKRDNMKHNGKFGKYGGIFVPELLIPAIEELEEAFYKFKDDDKFIEELNFYLKEFGGRPTGLYYAENLSKKLGCKIYLKREDMLHTGAHKINNAIGQGLLAKYMGKTQLIAETGAGQHGIATAVIGAKLGMDVKVFMGSTDVERQKLNVFRMELSGAEVIPVDMGSKTLKDSINEAFRYWISNLDTTHYLIGTTMGPHPYPTMVKYFQSVIGKEARKQILELEGCLPDTVIACVGGGSNAMGIFSGFVDDEDVDLIGVEAGGEGTETLEHGATITKGTEGILHGSLSIILQTEEGQIRETSSVSAGLDYPGVGPEHAYLHSINRAKYVPINNNEALEALKKVVSYQVSGSSHAESSGLSVYYPLKVEGSTELSMFESVCVSPYYLSFIDRQNLGSAYAGGYSEDGGSEEDEYYDEDSYWYDEDDWYDDSYWFDEDDCWGSGYEYEYDEECDCYRRKTKEDQSHWNYADREKETGESKLITFAEKPHLNDDGVYTFTLDKRGIENAAAVYGFVYEMSEDEKDFIEIGETFEINGDYNTGVFEDIFDGYWFSLPDGQNLATYIVENTENFVIYTSPILLNGKETNLRLKQTADGDITVEGVWDGISENGASSRKVTKIKTGDRIIPKYYSLDADTMEDGEWQGNEYVAEDDFDIYYGLLQEADYYYAFCIDDIYYDYYITEFEVFHVDENGEIGFYEE